MIKNKQSDKENQIYTLLKQLESMYSKSDSAHDLDHIVAVRDVAMELAKKYCPELELLVYIAATLHDIGLCIGPRESHESNGATFFLKNEDFKKLLTDEERHIVAEAIKEHRASTGNPTHVVGKIISDADRTARLSLGHSVYRSTVYSIENGDDPNHEYPLSLHLLRSLSHHYDKFAFSSSYGRRAYFKESLDKLESIFKPVAPLWAVWDFVGWFQQMDKELQAKLIAKFFHTVPARVPENIFVTYIPENESVSIMKDGLKSSFKLLDEGRVSDKQIISDYGRISDGRRLSAEELSKLLEKYRGIPNSQYGLFGFPTLVNLKTCPKLKKWFSNQIPVIIDLDRIASDKSFVIAKTNPNTLKLSKTNPGSIKNISYENVADTSPMLRFVPHYVIIPQERYIKPHWLNPVIMDYG